MPLSLDTDVTHLSRAISLAEGGRGRVSPNPLVGAVVVRDGKVLGEGFHAAYGEAHAERAALDACVADPRGATLYVSLEPCCHHGRTPPCTEAILEAGIARVRWARSGSVEVGMGEDPGYGRRLSGSASRPSRSSCARRARTPATACSTRGGAPTSAASTWWRALRWARS